MSVAAFDDVEIYYEIHGRGPPLVFAHGASGSHLSWWRQVPHFAQRYACLIYDQRGFGSSRVKGAYDPGDGNALARDLARLLAHVGMERDVVLVGNSLGTLPTLDFAANNPERVAALVLSGGYGGLRAAVLAPSEQDRRNLFARYSEALAAGEVPAAAISPVLSPDEAARFPALHQPFGPMGERMVREQPDMAFLYAELALQARGPPIAELAKTFDTITPLSAELVEKLVFPVLCIGGDEDRVFPPGCLKAAASCFPRGEHVTIAGSGHSVYFDNPKQFNASLDVFFESI